MKILCTADLHIGRRPSKLPPTSPGVAYSNTDVWGAIVDYAVREQVDAVALCGDVVDRANRYFEAYGPLERGLRKLGDAGIHTVAVAGNHDFDVLPKLADSIDTGHFHLIGRNGTWETYTLYTADGSSGHFCGWSFPHATVPNSPVVPSDIPAAAGLTIGLLHCDIDQHPSHYAPVKRVELQRLPFAFWVLGHLHKPTCYEVDGRPFALYPGSPQAMDPGESGPHGPWLLDIRNGEPPELTHIPLSRVRYEIVEVDVTGIADLDSLESHIPNAIKEQIDPIAADSDDLLCVSCRLRLSGRTSMHRQLDAMIDRLHDDFRLDLGKASVGIEKVVIQTRPDVDLENLSRGQDPPAVLARLILALNADGTDADGLVQKTTQKLKDIHGAGQYQAIFGDTPPDAESVREIVLRQANAMLDALLDQKKPV